MGTQTARPMQGGFTIIVVGLTLVALLSVFRVSGIETNIEPLDDVVGFVLKTIGFSLG